MLVPQAEHRIPDSYGNMQEHLYRFLEINLQGVCFAHSDIKSQTVSVLVCQCACEMDSVRKAMVSETLYSSAIRQTGIFLKILTSRANIHKPSDWG